MGPTDTRLGDVLHEDRVVPDLQARDKIAALRELVGTLDPARDLGGLEPDRVVDLLQRREELGSTGIGGGVAIPHVKVEGLPRLVMVIGRSRPGVDFDAVDGRPVQLLFLLLSPADDARGHLRLLQAAALVAQDEDVLSDLLRARDASRLTARLEEFLEDR